jgi:hypothetical protein
MDSGTKPLHIYCPTHSGGSSGMELQMPFRVFKASNNWSNTQPTELVYKKQERVFNLKGREIKIASGNTAIPPFPTDKKNSYYYKHSDYKDRLHSAATV